MILIISARKCILRPLQRPVGTLHAGGAEILAIEYCCEVTQDLRFSRSHVRPEHGYIYGDALYSPI